MRLPPADHSRSRCYTSSQRNALCCYTRPLFVGLYLRIFVVRLVSFDSFQFFPFLAKQSWSFSEVPFKRVRAKKKKRTNANVCSFLAQLSEQYVPLMKCPVRKSPATQFSRQKSRRGRLRHYLILVITYY